MAMRPRNPTFRTQPSLRPVYENVQPKSEMKENQEAYLLHIYLPGFAKERIKITYVASSRMVRIIGERPIEGGNRWSRFDQTYPIPENCEVERLQGKFEPGILTVTMPKKFISQLIPPKAQEETVQQNRITAATLKEQTGKSQKGQDEFEPKPNLIMAPKKKTDEKAQTGQDGIDPKPILTSDPSKQPDEKLQEETRQKTILATIKKELDERSVGKRAEDAENERVNKKGVKEADQGKPSESIKPEKDSEKGNLKEKEIMARKVSPKATEPSAPNATEKEKETSRRTSPISEEKKSKEDMIGTIVKGIREVYSSASQIVTRIAEGKLNDEEKPLVANMGAAVLVIAALGAYVSYKFASSERN